MSDWHSMRASDADRERGSDLLKAAMAEGRLSWDEYQARLDRLMRSRTYGEIHRVIDDLPSGVQPYPMRNPAYPATTSQPIPPVVRSDPGANGLATASLVCGVLVPFTCGLTSIPALITGHLALSRMDAGTPGKGMAIAGVVLGYLPIALVILTVIGFVLSS